MDNFKKENQTEIVAEENKLVLEDEAATKLSTGVPDLNAESLALIEQIAASTDENQTKDLTHLFNLNQTKKTLARVNKLSELMDTITDQALARFTQKPDEISNKDLFDGLKIVQDLIERGQKQASGIDEPAVAPLIQVNQQTNELNLNNTTDNLSRDSRERVKMAVLSLLNNITDPALTSTDSTITTTNSEEAEN